MRPGGSPSGRKKNRGTLISTWDSGLRWMKIGGQVSRIVEEFCLSSCRSVARFKNDRIAGNETII